MRYLVLVLCLVLAACDNDSGGGGTVPGDPTADAADFSGVWTFTYDDVCADVRPSRIENLTVPGGTVGAADTGAYYSLIAGNIAEIFNYRVNLCDHDDSLCNTLGTVCDATGTCESTGCDEDGSPCTPVGTVCGTPGTCVEFHNPPQFNATVTLAVDDAAGGFSTPGCSGTVTLQREIP